MGLDYIQEKKKGFRKLFNGGSATLADPGLFQVEQEWEEQHVLFDVPAGVTLTEGETVVVQIDGANLVALRGHDVVATAGDPPDSVMSAMRKTAGYVVARVAQVRSVSRTADIAFRLQ